MTFKPITSLLLFITIFTGLFQLMVGVGGLEARASPIANFVFLNGSYQDEQGGSGMDKVEYYLKYDTDKVGNSLDYGYNKVCDTNTKNWFGGYSCNGNLDYSLNDRILSAVAVATDKAGNRRTIGVYNYPNQNKIDVLTIRYLGDPIGNGVITGLGVGAVLVASSAIPAVAVVVNVTGVTLGLNDCANLLFQKNSELFTYISCGTTVIPVGTVLKYGGKLVKVVSGEIKGGKAVSKVVDKPKIVE